MITAIIEPKPDTDKQQALLDRVDSLLDLAREAANALDKNYVEIGQALLAVQAEKAWMLREHSWDAYILACGKRFKRSRTSLYGYVSVAERLLPYIPAEALVGMGISKSQPLAQYVKRKPELDSVTLKEALDDTISAEDFRAKLAERLHDAPDKEKWFEVPGFFVTAEERAELLRAYDIAARTEPPIPRETPDRIRAKIIQQRLAMNYLAEFEAEILQGGH